MCVCVCVRECRVGSGLGLGHCVREFVCVFFLAQRIVNSIGLFVVWVGVGRIGSDRVGSVWLRFVDGLGLR